MSENKIHLSGSWKYLLPPKVFMFWIIALIAGSGRMEQIALQLQYQENNTNYVFTQEKEIIYTGTS